MDRREALRLLAMGSALQLAPHNLLALLREARTLLGTQVASRTLNPHQDATVKAMAELMLPKTDTPGATDAGVSEFIDLMLREWYDESDRTRFLNGLSEVRMRWARTPPAPRIAAESIRWFLPHAAAPHASAVIFSPNHARISAC